MNTTISNLKIRKTVSKDFDAVFPLLQQLWDYKKLNRNRLRKTFLRSINSANEKYFCAEIDNKTVGLCSMMVINNLWQEGYICYVKEMVVDSSLRGKGIGTTLLKTIINLARKKGCKRIELDSAFHRKQTHKFYKSRGFEKRAYLFSKTL